MPALGDRVADRARIFEVRACKLQSIHARSWQIKQVIGAVRRMQRDRDPIRRERRSDRSESCDRPRRRLRTTAGSPDDIACSVGKSSAVPMLPNSTHAFRLSIHNVARLMAEPLNASAYSSGFIIRSSRAKARAPSREAMSVHNSRAANDGSFSSVANDVFQETISWEVWPYTHFEVPLSKGRSTLRKSLSAEVFPFSTPPIEPFRQ